MRKANALDLINTLDSRHQGVQPVLRQFVHGASASVSDQALNLLESPFAPVADILRDIRDQKVDAATRQAIATLDTRNEVLQPLLNALADGLE